MMFANHNYHPSRGLAACAAASCLLALAACASNQALDDQLATSGEAVEQARTAGAPETAPADFNTAHDKLSRANAGTRNEVVAMRLAEQAKADADLAHAKTGANHAMAAAEEIVRSNQALREEIRRAKQNQ